MTWYELKQAELMSKESWAYLMTKFTVESGKCRKIVQVAMDMKRRNNV